MKTAVFYSLLMLSITPGFADVLREGAFDAINISADEAIEDDRPGILHLSGSFRMRSDEWLLTSSKATVYGSPGKPDRIVLEGTPARFNFLPHDGPGEGPIEASALEVEYLREPNILKLVGDASLVLGNETIRSATIEYDIATNRYRAGGDSGVLIRVPPID